VPGRYRSRVQQIRAVLAVMFMAVILLAGCGGTKVSGADTRAVVVVSGGPSVSPFTTSSQACTTGLAASDTATAIREYLLEQGYQVYTSPMMAGRGPVTDQTGFGAFGNCPVTLPEIMTIDTTGDIDLGGEHLARFLTYLHTDKGVNEVDLVGHSWGGMWSRAAIHVLEATSSPIRIRSLTTLGTPWQGTYLADYSSGAIPLSDCLGDEFCEHKAKSFEVKTTVGGEDTQAFLMGKDGWSEAQTGMLDKIPVALIAGDRFSKPGQVNPTVWPNDGEVALQSALATHITDPVLPHRACYTFGDTHSIDNSSLLNLPWATALTWDPRVLDTLRSAIENAPKALDTANRQGCPLPSTP
jgi:triacylglycerol lipase